MPQHIPFCQCSCVIWCVPANLPKAPHAGALDVVLRLIDKSLFQRSHSAAHDDCQCQGFAEGSDVAKSHDAWQFGITVGLCHVVHQRSSPTAVHNELGQLRGVLGDLTHSSGCVLAHQGVCVLQALEYAREDLSFNHHFCQVYAVLGDLAQSTAHLPLELSVRVSNEGGQVGHSASINNCLCQLWSVLADV
eukprot:21103-Heterococcus_DN1.PRE.4